MKRLEEGKKYSSVFIDVEADEQFSNEFIALRNMTRHQIVYVIFDAYNEEYNERLKKYTADELFNGRPYELNKEHDSDFADYAEEQVAVYSYEKGKDYLTSCLGYKIVDIKPLDKAGIYSYIRV